MMRPAVTATRTSARIEARQGTTLPGWTVPTGNNDERRLMQAMIAIFKQQMTSMTLDCIDTSSRNLTSSGIFVVFGLNWQDL
jgi:hypothetical protein